MLELAIKIAVDAHQKQVDKAGEPYILHPLRLMFKFTDEDLRIIAILHDVIEDSDITEQNLIELGFKAEIIDALSNLTKIDGESYDDFIERAASNPRSRKIKIEDIKDNLNLERLERLSEVDLKRVEKYHRALKRLLSIDD